MYSTPKLLRYGKFRELTMQQQPCSDPSIDWTGKTYPSADVVLNLGADNSDGCPARS